MHKNLEQYTGNLDMFRDLTMIYNTNMTDSTVWQEPSSTAAAQQETIQEYPYCNF